MPGVVRRTSHTAFLEVATESDVESTLARLEAVTSSPGLAVFQRGWVEPYLTKRAKARFAAEGDDAVGKWAPLALATENIRESLGFERAHPINRRTGDLERYITESPADLVLGTQSATLLFPGQAGLTTELRDKLETAQRGKSSPKTPPRPVLGLSLQDLMATEAALLLYIREVVG